MNFHIRWWLTFTFFMWMGLTATSPLKTLEDVERRLSSSRVKEANSSEVLDLPVGPVEDPEEYFRGIYLTEEQRRFCLSCISSHHSLFAIPSRLRTFRVDQRYVCLQLQSPSLRRLHYFLSYFISSTDCYLPFWPKKYTTENMILYSQNGTQFFPSVVLPRAGAIPFGNLSFTPVDALHTDWLKDKESFPTLGEVRMMGLTFHPEDSFEDIRDSSHLVPIWECLSELASWWL